MDSRNSSRRLSFSIRTGKRRPSLAGGSRRGSTIGRVPISQLRVHSCHCLNITLFRVQDEEVPLPSSEVTFLSELFGTTHLVATLEKKSIKQPKLVGCRSVGTSSRWHIFRCLNCQLDCFALSISLTKSLGGTSSPLHSPGATKTQSNSSSPSTTPPEKGLASPMSILSTSTFAAVLNPKLKYGEEVVRLDESEQPSRAFGVIITTTNSERSPRSPASASLAPLDENSTLSTQPADPVRTDDFAGSNKSLVRSSSSHRTFPSNLGTSGGSPHGRTSTTLASSTSTAATTVVSPIPSLSSPSSTSSSADSIRAAILRTFKNQAQIALHEEKLAMEARISEYTAKQVELFREYERQVRADFLTLVDLADPERLQDCQGLELYSQSFSPRTRSALLDGMNEDKTRSSTEMRGVQGTTTKVDFDTSWNFDGEEQPDETQSPKEKDRHAKHEHQLHVEVATPLHASSTPPSTTSTSPHNDTEKKRTPTHARVQSSEGQLQGAYGVTPKKEDARDVSGIFQLEEELDSPPAKVPWVKDVDVGEDENSHNNLIEDPQISPLRKTETSSHAIATTASSRVRTGRTSQTLSSSLPIDIQPTRAKLVSVQTSADKRISSSISTTGSSTSSGSKPLRRSSLGRHDEDDADSSEFVPPHTMGAESFWSFAKLKYIQDETKTRSSLSQSFRHDLHFSKVDGATARARAGSDSDAALLHRHLMMRRSPLPSSSLATTTTKAKT